MRYDIEHKQRTQQKIIREAAKAIREQGPDKIGIANLMGRVGLTQGGFYAHFKSKNVLIAEAITHMFNERNEAFQKIMAENTPEQGMVKFIDQYLSKQHRDKPEKGCPVVALNSDITRMPIVARKSFEAGMYLTTESLSDIMKKLKKPHPHALATSILSEMLGALAVARNVSNDESSQQILEISRNSLKKRLGLNG